MYKQKYYYWEFVCILRKVLVVFAVEFLDTGRMRYVALSFIFAASLILQFACWPFTKRCNVNMSNAVISEQSLYFKMARMQNELEALCLSVLFFVSVSKLSFSADTSLVETFRSLAIAVTFYMGLAVNVYMVLYKTVFLKLKVVVMRKKIPSLLKKLSKKYPFASPAALIREKNRRLPLLQAKEMYGQKQFQFAAGRISVPGFQEGLWAHS